ncbi:MAG: fumarate hydratase [Deltaproteobacteria bacterium]|jgi:fumarate hydratase subunit alpha|nr:fumarate hydratase [Deltaproteobacteria bacterium]
MEHHLRRIGIATVVDAVKGLIQKTAFELPDFVKKDISRAVDEESSPLSKKLLTELLENAYVASKERIPLCQDSGLPKIVITQGEDCHISGLDNLGFLEKAVGSVYEEAFLRRSAADPLTRKNLGLKIPLSIEFRVESGDKVIVSTMAKGGGCDNKSVLFNLKPTTSPEDVKRAILEKIAAAGPDACPPYYIGICIGANFESAPLYASRALESLWSGKKPLPREGELSQEYLEAVNSLGIGPMAMGGRTTALNLSVKIVPTHIASLPVAISISCHSFRVGRVVL